MTLALLGASDARIDVGGATLVEGLSFQAEGRAVAIVGDASPLFQLFSSRAELRRGSVDVLGHPGASAVRDSVLGIVPSELVLPPRWTVTEYLTESARLLGIGRRDAAARATSAIERLELGPLARRALSVLGPFERRAVGLAQATLGAPRAIAIESPFDGLPDTLEAPLARLIERAAEGRSLVVSFLAPATVGAAAELAARADHAVVLHGSRVVASGPPASVLVPSRQYTVWAARAVTALAESLGAQGARVERPYTAGDAADSGRLVVRLPDGASTRLILDAALAAEAPILELVAVGFEA